MSLPKQFSHWKGIPREEIDWNPTVDADQCVGCGMCVTSCGRNVFDFDSRSNTSVVARPLQCMVGCTSCETWCVYGAISFPDKEYVRGIIRERGVLATAKKELRSRLQEA
jgi:NAD-dependent dihydropyrimidine dehydrogenase PreA subunit